MEECGPHRLFRTCPCRSHTRLSSNISCSSSSAFGACETKMVASPRDQVHRRLQCLQQVGRPHQLERSVEGVAARCPLQRAIGARVMMVMQAMMAQNRPSPTRYRVTKFFLVETTRQGVAPDLLPAGGLGGPDVWRSLPTGRLKGEAVRKTAGYLAL